MAVEVMSSWVKSENGYIWWYGNNGGGIGLSLFCFKILCEHSVERSGEETQMNPHSGLPVPQIQGWNYTTFHT